MCRLTEKVFKLKHRILILTQNDQHSQQIDDALWTFRESSFVPHVKSTHFEQNTPIYISHTPAKSSILNDILINLSPTTPPIAQHFNRVVEIVEPAESTRQLARQHFRTYKAQGFHVLSHDIPG